MTTMVPIEYSPIAPRRPMRVQRLEKPEKAALDQQLAVVYAAEIALQANILEIKTVIESKLKNKHVVPQAILDARSLLTDLVSTFRSVMEERRRLREELDAADKMRENMRADARSLRDRLPYVKVEQIDEEIKRLDYRISHTSISIQEEKKLLQQMRDLTKSRDFVKDYCERMEKITQDETSRVELLERIRQRELVLSDLKAKQDVQKKILAAAKAKHVSESGEIPALIEAKNAALAKTKALKDDARLLKAQFRINEDCFWEREREWKEQQAAERREKYEKREVERKERAKVRKQRELENFVEPFTDEIIMCEQLISYLQKFVPVAEDMPNSGGSLKTEVVVPKGVGNLLVSKKNRPDELDGWFAGFGSKAKEKKTKVPTAPKSKEKEKLVLSLDALTSFQKLKLSPPTIMGDTARSIDELKLKKNNFLELQKLDRERRETGDSLAVATDGKTAVKSLLVLIRAEIDFENGEESMDKLQDGNPEYTSVVDEVPIGDVLELGIEAVLA